MLMCFSIWFVLNTVTILCTEIFTLATQGPREKSVVLCGYASTAVYDNFYDMMISPFSFEIPWLAIELYRNLGYCVLGAATTFVLTDMSKFTVGRLRPHFLRLCEPDFSQIKCKTEDGLYEQFITGAERNITTLCKAAFDKAQEKDGDEGYAAMDKVNAKH